MAKERGKKICSIKIQTSLGSEYLKIFSVWSGSVIKTVIHGWFRIFYYPYNGILGTSYLLLIALQPQREQLYLERKKHFSVFL